MSSRLIYDIIISFIIVILHDEVGTLIHEFGHAMKLKKYENNPAIGYYSKLLFLIFRKKKFCVDINGIDVFYVANKKSGHITYSPTNYKKLKDDEISDVANGGIICTKLMLMVLLGVAILFRLYVLLAYVIVMSILYLISKKKVESDFIWKKDPDKLINYFEQLPEDSEQLYENLIKEYKK